jgi:hypothetical protein
MLHLTSTEDAAKLAQRAVDVVEAEIGELPSDSPLLDDFLFLIDHHDSYVAGLSWDDAYDFEKMRVKLRREVGALEVAKRIVGLSNCRELAKYGECLELLREGGVSQASLFQDYDQQWGEPLNQTRKIFEFYVSSGIRLNGHQKATVAGKADNTQQNPDVLVDNYSIEGVACKVVSGQNLQTLIENIEKGSSQVEKSVANKGLVALDVRHRIDTELLFPLTGETTYRTFRYAPHAEALVQKLLGDIADEVLNATTPEWRQARFQETNCKAFILIAQSCAVIETEHGPVPTLVGKGRVIPIVDGQDPELDDALEIARWIGDSVPMPNL